MTRRGWSVPPPASPASPHCLPPPRAQPLEAQSGEGCPWDRGPGLPWVFQKVLSCSCHNQLGLSTPRSTTDGRCCGARDSDLRVGVSAGPHRRAGRWGPGYREAGTPKGQQRTVAASSPEDARSGGPSGWGRERMDGWAWAQREGAEQEGTQAEATVAAGSSL